MSIIDSVGRLEKNDPAPLYLQLQKVLREAIRARVFVADDAIPPERDLAEAFDVSRITVRKAIDGLVNEGLLTRRRGAGTFVAARVEKSFSKLSSFSEDMISRGRKPHSVWVSKSEGAVTPEEALSLGLSPGSLVYRFHRIRGLLPALHRSRRRFALCGAGGLRPSPGARASAVARHLLFTRSGRTTERHSRRARPVY
jgi:GntR family transcriptional regulator